MPIIETQTHETATGNVREVYDQVLQRLPFVPKPVQVMSASPEFIPHYWQMITHVLDQPRLSRALMAHIRLGVAMHSEYPYCVDLNTQALATLVDATPEEIAAFREDPAAAKLPENERALVSFVVRAIREPEEVDQSDVQRLRDLGWTDPDIFDATYMGAFMLTSGVLFNTFKMHEE
jgi:uncharacterized peroxidase-related enzyme